MTDLDPKALEAAAKALEYHKDFHDTAVRDARAIVVVYLSAVSEPEMIDGAYRGLDAARVVAEHLPSEADGTATIHEVAQRRKVLIDYLQEAAIERASLRRQRDEALRITPAVSEPVQEPTDERRERLLADLAAEGSARCCYAPGCMSAEAWITSRCDCKHVNPIVRPHGEETGCCEMRAAYRVLAEAALAAVRPSPPQHQGGAR
jgi:hypothetical protein